MDVPKQKLDHDIALLLDLGLLDGTSKENMALIHQLIEVALNKAFVDGMSFTVDHVEAVLRAKGEFNTA